MNRLRVPCHFIMMLLACKMVSASPDGIIMAAKDFNSLLTNAPKITSVEARKKSTCFIIAMQEKTKISELISSGTKSMVASGVLISTNPPLILTSKHTFCKPEPGGIQLVKDPNKVKVLFNYYDNSWKNIPDAQWYEVDKILGGPTSCFSAKPLPVELDFVILQLKTTKSLPADATIAPILFDWKQNSTNRPFTLHHAECLPMQISYPGCNSPECSLIPTFTQKNGVWKFILDVPVGLLRINSGSSGGGVYYGSSTADANEGKLVAINTEGEKYSMVNGKYVLNKDGIIVWESKITSIDGIRDPFTGIAEARALFGSKTVPRPSLIGRAAYRLLSAGITPDNFNSFNGTYKYLNQHTSGTGYIWFDYGDVSGEKTVEIPLKSYVLGTAPKGNYHLTVDMMKSITSVKIEDNSPDPTPVTLDNTPLNAVRISFVNKNMANGGIQETVIGDILNNDFTYGLPNGVNDNHAYSNITNKTFNVNIPIDNLTEQYIDNLYIKISAPLRYRDGIQNDIVQGVSLHDITLDYVDEDGDNIPCYNDNCPCKEHNNPPENGWTDINGDVHNGEQKDTDLDGKGDMCDPKPRDPNDLFDDPSLIPTEIQDEFNRNTIKNLNFYWTPDPTAFKYYINWGDDYITGKSTCHTDREIKPTSSNVTYTHPYLKSGTFDYSIYQYNKSSLAVTTLKEGSFKIIYNKPGETPSINSIQTICGTAQTNQPLTVALEATNVGGYPQLWRWDFGDGTVVDLPYTWTGWDQNIPCNKLLNFGSGEKSCSPLHTYPTPGAYTVTVQAFGCGAKSSLVSTKTITVLATMTACTGKVKPVVQISACPDNLTSDVTAHVGLSAYWDNVTSGELLSVEWDLGNGIKKYGQHIQYDFNRYQPIPQIKATVTTCGGVDTATLDNNQLWPCSWMSMTNTGTTATTVSYLFAPANNIGGTINHCHWYIAENYGMYNTIMNKMIIQPSNFNYSYTFPRDVVPRNYLITFYPINNYGGSWIDRVITINPISPNVDFSVNKQKGSATFTATFTATNIGGRVLEWLWDFGDGETSNVQNPVHIYKKKGVYTVSLRARNEAFDNVKTKASFITVTPNITPILQLLLGD